MSLDATKPLTVAGQLRLPPSSAKLPAVVIVHGSAGVDSRGSMYAQALNKAGIATLEIDMWAARGLIGGLSRPRGVPETLPDAYGALKYLAERPEIDPARIGIMGFSWGGVVSMLTATAPYTEQYLGKTLKFAAHVPLYPVCWVYNTVPGYEFRSFTGAPVLIQAGERDTYDDPDTCIKLVQMVGNPSITVKVYPGATHAFDRLEPEIRVNDPFAHKGRGGEVIFTPNPALAQESVQTTVSFFKRVFGLP
ncbi:dienelactone hydrolase family protein [Meiothermus sp.]|uniref:dienelactone hydrolase family protein n=1 Tax=Meiothermus sp. TaxID=1955249 RepID=UPI002602B6A4|nr:dienelactone hydrolase family protein [Meiothermus sp.]